MSTEVKKESESAREDEQKVIKTLEEDDEFEDFPEDDKFGNQPKVNTANLWEEDWDDDDNQDEFSKKLREELKKAQA
ncbi:putative 26 proteasome complex subunit Sem1 [Scheffersomyces amazonensis]|uniref:putative 26 proteasome complex subunit Sem1 n=1 Tax=Scheffersomyces amazonensis TaxID=1078765 RepID=UPI00315CD1E2